MPILLFLLPFFLLLTSTAHAIEHYSDGDTLFVWANSGLTLRAKPDFKGEKIALLSYGTAVIARDSKYRGMGENDYVYVTEIPASKDFPGLKIPGRWLSVTAGNLSGFVFDGYLSHLPTLKTTNSQGDREQMLDYAIRVWGLTHKQITHPSPEGNDELFVFKNGASCFKARHEGGSSSTWQIPYLSFEEGYLLFARGRNPTEPDEQAREMGFYRTLEFRELDNRFIEMYIKIEFGPWGSDRFKWMPGIFIYESDGGC